MDIGAKNADEARLEMNKYPITNMNAKNGPGLPVIRPLCAINRALFNTKKRDKM